MTVQWFTFPGVSDSFGLTQRIYLVWVPFMLSMRPCRSNRKRSSTAFFDERFRPKAGFGSARRSTAPCSTDLKYLLIISFVVFEITCNSSLGNLCIFRSTNSEASYTTGAAKCLMPNSVLSNKSLEMKRGCPFCSFFSFCTNFCFDNEEHFSKTRKYFQELECSYISDLILTSLLPFGTTHSSFTISMTPFGPCKRLRTSELSKLLKSGSSMPSSSYSS